eukprot:1047252-Prymnesium_polylepis.2
MCRPVCPDGAPCLPACPVVSPPHPLPTSRRTIPRTTGSRWHRERARRYQRNCSQRRVNYYTCTSVKYSCA